MNTRLKRKSQLKRSKKPLKKTPLKRSKLAPKRKTKTKQLSPRLGINNNARCASYKRWKGYRYKGIKGVAWTILSQYIRHRDDFKCATCPESNPQVMQAGHYIPAGISSNSKLAWDEMNIHCQCKRCNEDLGGMQDFMGDYIAEYYGVDVRNDLKTRRYLVDPVEDWEQIIIHYEQKLYAIAPWLRDK